jgi:hypothetical protein
MFWLTVLSTSAAASSAPFQTQPAAAPQLDRVMLFGFLAALFTLGCLPHVRRARGARLLLTMSLAAQTVYGFLSGAWPLGMVALVVSSMAARWWWRSRTDIGLALDAPKRCGRYGLAAPGAGLAARLADRGWSDEHHADQN